MWHQKKEVEGERRDEEWEGLAAGRRCETGGRFEGTGRQRVGVIEEGD